MKKTLITLLIGLGLSAPLYAQNAPVMEAAVPLVMGVVLTGTSTGITMTVPAAAGSEDVAGRESAQTEIRFEQVTDDLDRLLEERMLRELSESVDGSAG